ncbi:MAG: DNA translocase FtsK 4TM domain-containing protein [Moraxella sp.]|nr:DNA translocase FtsK 4TM domain-containing protein [Moraxella sp.]
MKINQLLQNESVNQLLGRLPLVQRLLFSVVGVAILAFLFISLLSYNPADPAWSHVGSSQEISNVGGRLGAWLSDILLSFFGFGAWFLLLVLAYELVKLWWGRTSIVWVLRVLAYAFLLACISGIAAQLGAWWQDGAADFGGVLGYEFMTSLSGVLGVAASVAFLVLIGLIVATLTFDIRWLSVWRQFRSTPSDDDTTEEMQPQVDDEWDDDLTDDELIISQIKPKTPSYQPHNHEGALESFLVNSGLRDEFLAKKQAEEEAQRQEAQKQARIIIQDDSDEVAQDIDAMADDVHQGVSAVHHGSTDTDHQSSYQDNYQGDHQSDYLDSHQDEYSDYQDDYQTQYGDDGANTASDIGNSHWDEPADVVADDTPSKQWRQADEMGDESVAFGGVDMASLGVQDKPKPVAPVVDKMAGVASGTVRPKSHAMSTLEYRMSLSPVPPLDILDPKPTKIVTYTPQELEQLSELLEIKLQEFNIKAQVISAMVGPVVTRFEVDLAAGVKASRVIKISQDLARSMRMTSLRVIPVIAGKSYIGIEVPNKKRQIVSLIELLDTADYQDPNAGISIAIGADISGKPVIADLAKAPHMLVAGTTGSGKSVLVNSFLMSMLLKYTPDELRLVLIDPKQLELANYGDIPHLLTPVITDMTEATAALNWCVTEMERRYLLMSKLRVRNIAAFNQKVIEANERGEPILDPMWSASDHVGDRIPQQKPLPKIVVVADEFADMIMQLGKTAEEPIVRLAQKSRAAGIHLILATQRPVANVVTGLIKSNIPSRVALRVNSATDSRIIIEESGAENMLGHGDMMFLAPGAIEIERVHGAYVKDDEVNRVTDAWRERGSPDYIDLTESYTFEGEGSGDTGAGSDDEYFDLAVSYILETRKVSISALQRKFSIGYNRAARIVDMMEERGIVSAQDNNGKRQILM